MLGCAGLLELAIRGGGGVLAFCFVPGARALGQWGGRLFGQESSCLHMDALHTGPHWVPGAQDETRSLILKLTASWLQLLM